MLSRAKDSGVVRAVGRSNHEFGALCACVDDPWRDVVLVRLHACGINMDAETDKVVPAMKALGKGEMDDARAAIGFQLESPVDAFIVGVESGEQVTENVRLVQELMVGKATT